MKDKIINAIAFTLFLETWCDENEGIEDFPVDFINSLKIKWENHWLPAKSEEHCGDCTNVPMPCTRCNVEDLFKLAEKLYSIMEN